MYMQKEYDVMMLDDSAIYSARKSEPVTKICSITLKNIQNSMEYRF